MKIYENEYIFIEKEENEIPWIKIFSKKKYKEFTHCDDDTKIALLSTMQITEQAMLDFYKPDKINIAMFGNYMPIVHIHVIARFKEDSFFPESVWGVKQRKSNLNLPKFKKFEKALLKRLKYQS